MVFVPGPNIAQAEIRMVQDSQQIENVLYFDMGGVATPSDYEQLAFDLWQWWAADRAPLTAPQVSLVEVYVTDLTSDTAPVYSYTGTSGPITGTAASAVLPANVTICVSFRTAGRGRSARGRNYVPGLTEADVVNNTLDAGTAGSILEAYQELLPEGAITTGTWVVFSREEDGAPRTIGLAQPVTSVVITDRTVDSQRRRLPGRGR